jgi:quercetin dioxygenase-like cupin family protein
MEGQLKMTIADEVYNLEAGDSLCFKSHLPHRWENVGDEDAKVIWTLSPFTII